MTKVWEVNDDTLKRMEKAEKEREQLEQQVFHLKELLDHYREREKQAAELLREYQNLYPPEHGKRQAVDQWLRDAGVEK